MTADRAEWTGVGAALLFHVALIVALSTSLASVDDVPEPPSMEVELVDEVGLQAAAPTPIAQPAASQPPPMPMPMPSETPPLPQPIETPLPSRPEPAPVARPKPQPQRPAARPAPQRPAPRAQAQPQRRAGLGDDFLKSFDDDLAPRAGASRPAAPTFNAKAKMNVGQAIIQQAERCAEREPFLGEGANKIRLTVNLKFTRSGRLARSPSILGTAGDAEDRAKYGQLLEDQVRRIFAACSPFRLPADLYDTPSGGWKDFTFTYRVD